MAQKIGSFEVYHVQDLMVMMLTKFHHVSLYLLELLSERG